MKKRWILARFALIGASAFVARHGLSLVPAATAEPVRVTVARTASADELASAVDTALLIDAAIAHGALSADPIVREELLRIVRALPSGPRGGDQALLAEAVRLNLHVADRVVRERLRFAGEQLLLAQIAQPSASDQDLRDYIAAHGARYLEPDAVSLRLVALRGQGEAALVRAKAVRAQLVADPGRELHEHAGLPSRLLGATENTLAQRLGQPAARAIANLPLDVWSEPQATPYGFVLARVFARSAAAMPSFAALRERVSLDRAHDQRAELLTRALRALRDTRAVDVVRAL